MKTFREIQRAKQPGDYEIVANALDLSAETVKKIVNGSRTDVDGKVQGAFTMLLRHRAESVTVISKRIRRKYHKLQTA